MKFTVKIRELELGKRVDYYQIEGNLFATAYKSGDGRMYFIFPNQVSQYELLAFLADVNYREVHKILGAEA